ncbi:hypothetical protein ACIRN4_27045 [Pimelobacter simplex]|uniref:hypothetical protein n=1 Tax=Nocardioides simplex TaxID=2045 RepID=UPI00380A3B6A
MASALVALAISAATLAGCSSDSPKMKAEGPVSFQADPDLGQYSAANVDQGATMVYGLMTVLNSGEKPATLTSAKLTGPADQVADEGVEVREVRVYDVTGGKEVVGADRWPSQPQARDSVPLKGYQLAPNAEAELLFVIDVVETGHWGWPQTELSYEADGEDYTIRIGAGYYVCPASADTCERVEK